MAVWERIIRVAPDGKVTKQYFLHSRNITEITGATWAAAVRAKEQSRTLIEYPDTFTAVVIKTGGAKSR